MAGRLASMVAQGPTEVVKDNRSKRSEARVSERPAGRGSRANVS